MFSDEVISLLIKVVSSWQVIVAAIALLIYLKLVFYVASARRAQSFDLAPRVKPQKVKKEKTAAAPEASDSDELGLEEE